MSKLIRYTFWTVVLLAVVGAAAVGGVVAYLEPRLPSIESLRDVRLQVPLRVYASDGELIAEFGEKRRSPLTMEQIPDLMVQAVLAAEDDRFYEHPGVDWQGLTRAVLHLIRTGEKGPGGSTITMQVARNFFLGSEKTYVRKVNEILLALKIERELSKNEILELYFNKIFLGNRAYGVGAAAQVYYGSPLEDLNLAQVAMIAGLPKAPSRFNPIVNPDRALLRRAYVLGRMRGLNFITEEAFREAMSSPVTASLHGLSSAVEAPYAAEMVRAHMEEQVGAEAYTAGYRVYTTIDTARQSSANRAVRQALLDYDRRHGYRGPEFTVPLDGPDAGPEAVLKDVPVVGGLVPAVITAVEERTATAWVRNTGVVTIEWEGLSWARAHKSENSLGPKPKTAGDVVSPGDVVRVVSEVRVEKKDEGKDKETKPEEPEAGAGEAVETVVWKLSQVPSAEGALVALDPLDGAIVSLAGGFDFYRSKFNRVTQARRQPGSNFKPFVYSAAIEQGHTAASMINDAPVVFEDSGLEAAWRPENYSGKFFGPTRLREALIRSRNLVSIRLLRAVGIEYTVEYLEHFGWDPAGLPRNLSLALGSAEVTPLELARAYAVFANGGFLVEPYLVQRVEDADGQVVMEATPARVCSDCEQAGDEPVAAAPAPGEPGVAADAAPEPVTKVRYAPRVITPQNAWIMNSMMQDVIKRGTGRRALKLGRKDLAGKTGTTNEQRDAWFSGFTPALVATAWVGFDKLTPLGTRETGGRAALPMWVAFMEDALKGVPEFHHEQPEGLVTVRIDPATGELTSATDPDAIFETFRSEKVPQGSIATETSTAKTPVAEDNGGVTERLF